MKLQDLNTEIAEHLGLEDNRGALVSYVAESSPAQKYGIKNGDVIIKIGDQRANSADEAVELIRLLWDGDEASFEILRKGEIRNFLIKIEYNDLIDVAEKSLGIVVQVPTPQLAEKYGLSSFQKGVLIANVIKDSRADEAKLKVGDLILRLSKERVSSFRRFSISNDIGDMDDFTEFISDMQKGQVIKIIFERKGKLWQSYVTASQD